MKEKIIQIIPAPENLYVEYRNDDEPDKPFISKAICLGLSSEGEVHVMDIDDMGCIDISEKTGNFNGIIWSQKTIRDSD